MRLDFSGKVINAIAVEKSSKVSVSTGKRLCTYSFDISVRGQDKLEKFQNMLNKYKDENLNELNDSDEVVRRFRVTNSSYSYNGRGDDDDTVYHYTVEISEYEVLSTSVLAIAGVDCEVLLYEESIDEKTNAIVIDAIIKQTEDDRKKINDNIAGNEYFDVIRKDISDAVLKMRYGKSLWSKHEGFIKRKIVLVHEKYDEGNQKAKYSNLLNEPELPNVMELLAKQIRYIALLEESLIKKGVIGAEEVTKMKVEVDDTYVDNLRSFYLVDDVEDYGL